MLRGGTPVDHATRAGGAARCRLACIDGPSRAPVVKGRTGRRAVAHRAANLKGNGPGDRSRTTRRRPRRGSLAPRPPPLPSCRRAVLGEVALRGWRPRGARPDSSGRRRRCRSRRRLRCSAKSAFSVRWVFPSSTIPGVTSTRRPVAASPARALRATRAAGRVGIEGVVEHDVATRPVVTLQSIRCARAGSRGGSPPLRDRCRARAPPRPRRPRSTGSADEDPGARSANPADARRLEARRRHPASSTATSASRLGARGREQPSCVAPSRRASPSRRSSSTFSTTTRAPIR